VREELLGGANGAVVAVDEDDLFRTHHERVAMPGSGRRRQAGQASIAFSP
jgi:hypothetical protein